MRDVTELSELEAKFVINLTKSYPAGYAFSVERDPDMQAFAAELIDEQRVERTEINEQGVAGVAYRLTDTYADEIRQTAADRADRADMN
jgi:hypothetical protein